MPSLRILIADDHSLMRRRIGALLEQRPEWRICGEAATGSEAVAKARELKPDIVILDMTMPDLNGLEAARKIRQACHDTEILILSVHYSDQLIREIVNVGVRGYIVKSDTGRDLVIAIENLAKHKRYYNSYATEVILSKFNSGGTVKGVPGSVTERLTAREREFVQRLAEGKTSKQIASLLGISLKTAEIHRANIMRKLDLHGVTQLVRYAVRNQITQI